MAGGLASIATALSTRRNSLPRNSGRQGAKVAVLRADLADFSAVERLVPQCVAALGAPTCLVNNASTFVYDDVTSLDPQIWDCPARRQRQGAGVPGQGLRRGAARGR